MPVSYTHLDVYKRQERISYRHGGSVMAEGVGFPFPSLPLTEGRTYGQPDVYKRQNKIYDGKPSGRRFCGG